MYSIKRGLLFAATTFAYSAVAQESPMNIILINLDDVGLGDFSHSGAVGYTTPNIDQLAADGMRFSQYRVAQPISGASRASLLTGCYPNRIGFHGAPGPGSVYGIHKDEMTLGELVQQSGYATAIFGKWHLGDAHNLLPLQNGFDEYYGLPYSNDMWPYHPQQGTIFNFPALPTIDGNEIIGYDTDQTKFTTDYTTRSIDFIKRNQDGPFLLYLAHSMAHVPLAVSDKFKGKSEQGLYGDVMMELDWSIGEIMKTLDELGIAENTLVILTSDNGPWTNYGNHAGSAAGLREAKATTFDGGNRVPFIVSLKGVTSPGTISNRLISSIDVFPTIADITGSPLPKNKIDGVSFLELIKGEDRVVREHFAYYYHKNSLEAVTDGTFKLVFPHTYVTYGAFPPGNDGQPGDLTNLKISEPELYDLRRDPGERYNVIELYPEAAKSLMEFAEQIKADLGDDLSGIEGPGRREVGLPIK